MIAPTLDLTPEEFPELFEVCMAPFEWWYLGRRAYVMFEVNDGYLTRASTSDIYQHVFVQLL